MSVEWGSFDSASEQCYYAMAAGTMELEPWEDAFSLFRKGVVRMNMEKTDAQKISLEDLEESTGWTHDLTDGCRITQMSSQCAVNMGSCQKWWIF